MDESARRLLDSVTRSLERAAARSDQQDARTCCEAAACRATIGTPIHLPDEVWEPLIRHAAKQAVRSVRYGLEYAALCCESPIEELMLLSLAVAAATLGAPALVYEGHPAPFDDRDEELGGLVTIQPQVMVGKYRIDFEVGYHLGKLGAVDRDT